MARNDNGKASTLPISPIGAKPTHRDDLEIAIADYRPWADGELTRGIMAGEKDCIACGRALRGATVALVGRATLRGNVVVFCACKKCSRRAGGFNAASRIAAQAFCRTALRDDVRLVTADEIHPAVGHA